VVTFYLQALIDREAGYYLYQLKDNRAFAHQTELPDDKTALEIYKWRRPMQMEMRNKKLDSEIERVLVPEISKACSMIMWNPYLTFQLQTYIH
jgi:hypothetical protein